MIPNRKLKFTIATITAACGLFVPFAHAVLISADYLTAGDGWITRDTQTGLDWLDINLTYNRQSSDVPALTGVGGSFAGFRQATAAEFATLYSDADLTYSHYSGSPNATDAAYISKARSLQNLLGYSTPFPSPNVVNYITAGFLSGPLYNYTFGLIGVYDYAPGQGTDYYRAETYGVSGFSADYVGLSLVKDMPVPEPSTWVAGALLLLPFGAGVIRRFRK